MSRTLRRRSLLLAALGSCAGLGLLATGCGRREDAPASTSNSSPAGDGLRIASQTVLSDEVLWALGPAVHQQVVAVSALCDDPRYSGVVGRWPAALPRAAGTSEALIALSPTLVIIASFTAAETRRMLQDVGVRTLVLEAFDGFEDYRGNVRAIGEAVGASAAAEGIVEQFDQRLASLRRDDDPDSRPRAISWNDGNVPGAGTTFDDVATAAGYRNLPALEGRQGHLQLPVEQLVAWDPDTIVIPCGEDDCATVTRDFAERPGIRGTAAAREGRIVGIPSSALYSTGAAMLDVVERLRAAHAPTEHRP